MTGGATSAQIDDRADALCLGGAQLMRPRMIAAIKLIGYGMPIAERQAKKSMITNNKVNPRRQSRGRRFQGKLRLGATLLGNRQNVTLNRHSHYELTHQKVDLDTQLYSA